MIRAILSDLGNVAVFFDNGRADAAIAALTGRDRAAVSRAAFAPGLCRRFSTGDVDASQYHRIVCAKLGLAKAELPPEEDFCRAYADVFTPNEPVLERWALLRKTLALTAVSNIEPPRRDRLRRMGVLDRFDHLVLSCEEGLAKPSAELMVRALDRTGVSAEEALFVDDIAANLVPAAELGIVVHHYTSVEALDACLESLGLAAPAPC